MKLAPQLLEIKRSITAMDSDITAAATTVNTLTENVDSLKCDIVTLEDKLQVKTRVEFIALATRVISLEDDIKRSASDINSFLDLELPKVVKVDTKYLHALEDKEATLNYLINTFLADTGSPRKAIIQQFLPYLNKLLDDHLTTSQSEYSLTFDASFKPTIKSKGREVQFGALSAGQKASLNLAISFAFLDVSVKTSGVKFSPIFIDEFMEVGSLDEIGINAGYKILDNLVSSGQNAFCISHHPDAPAKYDHTVTIKKIGQFSTIHQ